MTVVLEDQVKTIAAEVGDQYGSVYLFDNHAAIEDVVRTVIAMYDISSIKYHMYTGDSPFNERAIDLAAVALEDGPR